MTYVIKVFNEKRCLSRHKKNTYGKRIDISVIYAKKFSSEQHICVGMKQAHTSGKQKHYVRNVRKRLQGQPI